MRWRALLLVALIAPLGLAIKLYAGPGASLVRSYAGGLFFLPFWMLVVVALRRDLAWSESAVWRLAGWVLLATCGLEFLQLWDTPALAALRGTFLGHALIGATFSWPDFATYFVGAALGIWVVRWLTRAPD